MAAIARLPATPTAVFDLPDPGVGPVGRERRIAPRSRRKFHVRSTGDNTIWSGIDLSFGGLMCSGDEPIWPGNLLELELVLAGEAKTIKAQARVVDLVSKDGEVAMRMRFEGLSAPSKQRVAEWVAEL